MIFDLLPARLKNEGGGLTNRRAGIDIMPTDYERDALPTHTLNAAEAAWVAKLPPKERKLHEMAVKSLNSSYFVEWTHAFKRAAAAKK